MEAREVKSKYSAGPEVGHSGHRPESRQASSEGSCGVGTPGLPRQPHLCPGVATMHTSREPQQLYLQCGRCPRVVCCSGGPALPCTSDCQSGVSLSHWGRAAVFGAGTPENGRKEGLASPRGNTHQLLPQPPTGSARLGQGQPAGPMSRQSD